jgi:hypothetical protein
MAIRISRSGEHALNWPLSSRAISHTTIIQFSGDSLKLVFLRYPAEYTLNTCPIFWDHLITTKPHYHLMGT